MLGAQKLDVQFADSFQDFGAICGGAGIGIPIRGLYQNDLLFDLLQYLVVYALFYPVPSTRNVKGFGTLALGALYRRPMCLVPWF